MKNRLNKITGEEQKDIHESNKEYLVKSYNNSLNIAEKYNWNKVICTEEKSLRTIDDIHEEIYKKVKNII